MGCCQCQGIQKMFDEKTARRELKRYLKKGPANTTQMLLDAIHKLGVQGLDFLDIGGGIGAIQNDLLKAGAIKGTNIDASEAYINVAKEEAAQKGWTNKVNFKHGDFTIIATNEDLVKRAVQITEGMGVKVLSPAEVREKMQLQKRWG